MRVKTRLKEESTFEKIVSITTADGRDEEIAVHPSQIVASTLEVVRIRDQGDAVLVELPQESSSGNWRIWISNSSVVE